MKKYLKEILISILVIFLMIIATLFDLKIDQNINNPSSWWALIFEVIGEFPIYIGLLLFSITYFNIQSNKKMKSLYLVLVYFSTFLFILMPSRYFVSMKMLNLSIILLVSTMVFFLITYLSRKIKKEYYEKIKNIALMCGIGIVVELLLITLLKQCWSRVRFFELDEDYSQFTPWYIINWFEGNHTSFPSGHTAGATNILYLSLITPLFTDDKKKHIFITSLCYVFIALTAFSRLVLGRHYLSDVVMAFAITYVIHKIVVYVVKHRQKNNKSI